MTQIDLVINFDFNKAKDYQHQKIDYRSTFSPAKRLSKIMFEQVQPVIVQVAQNVPSIVLNNTKRFFKLLCFFLAWCDKRI